MRSPVTPCNRETSCSLFTDGAAQGGPYSNFLKSLARPTRFELVTSAFGELWNHFAAFSVQCTWNATKTSYDYADIPRTAADVLGGRALVVGVVMTVDALQRFHAHGEEPGRLPRSVPACISQVAHEWRNVCGVTSNPVAHRRPQSPS